MVRDVEGDSPLRGMGKLKETLVKRAESQVKLRERIGALVQEITGQDIFDQGQEDSVSKFNTWGARLSPNGEGVVAYLKRDVPGGQEHVIEASYGTESGLRISGEAVELEERIDGSLRESTPEEVREAFRRAMARPFIAGKQ